MNAVHDNSESGQPKKRFVWTAIDKQIRDRPSDSEETITFEADDDSKIKPEVELKEETENFIYKADYRGHLQLVSIAHGVPNHPNPAENVEQWSGVKPAVHTSDEEQQVIISWREESNQSDGNVYQQLKNMSNSSVDESDFIKEEPSEDSPQGCTYGHSLPEIYDYSSDGTWEAQAVSSSQLSSLSNSSNLSDNMVLLTQAEKKRLYRMRIKEENPDMWSSIKKREAARKREQREKRRQVIFEMQKAMESAALPDSPEAVNQRLYLEALKERYPELWSQLIDALPETEMRNEQLYNERNVKSRRNIPKPVRMYKDVIEAQKKRLYRQRETEQRPEMYERQKARDAYSRSLQRLMLKRKQLSQNNVFDPESSHLAEMDKKLTYLHNMQLDSDPCDESANLHCSREMNSVNAGSELVDTVSPLGISPTNVLSQIPNAEVSASTDFGTKSDPSQVCDNKHSEDNCSVAKNSSSDSNISENDRTKDAHEMHGSTFPKNLSSACYKQSDMLWFWNDVRGNDQCLDDPELARRADSELARKADADIPYSLWRKGPQILTEEERLQKILKERMHLKEKRKRYRLSMTPEKRTEFLEVERERLKVYRMKKKGTDTELENMVESSV